jgi:hypothetical protein
VPASGLLGEREREREKWVAGTVSVGRDGGRERRSLGLGWRSVACGGLRGPDSVGDGSRAPFVRGRRSAGSRVEIGGLRWSERAGQCRRWVAGAVRQGSTVCWASGGDRWPAVV